MGITRIPTAEAKFLHKPTEVHKFGLDKKSFSKVAQILYSNIYSDKIEAPIREYLSNAWDAHVVVKNTEKPIEVHLPNVNNPSVIFRDFGCGIDPKDFHKIYCSYAGSTKEGDANQIGQFGIGAKSAFAYAEQFSVALFWKGKKYVYNCSLGKEGAGESAKIGEFDTVEPDGIEVSYAIKSNDISSFIEKFWNVARWMPVQPKIVRGEQRPFEKGDEVIASNNKYSVLTRKNGSYVVNGIVAYPIDVGKLMSSSVSFPSYYTYLLKNYDLEIKLPSGSFDFTGARESLSYSRRTLVSIKWALRNIFKSFVNKFPERKIHCSSLFEFSVKFNELYKEIDFRKNLKLPKITLYYNNEEVKEHDTWKHIINSTWLKNNPDEINVARMFKYRSTYAGNIKLDRSYWGYEYVNNCKNVKFYAIGDEKHVNRRIKKLKESGELLRNLYFFTEHSNLHSVLDTLGVKYSKLADVEPAEKERRSLGSFEGVSIKHGNIFVAQYTYSDYISTGKSYNWTKKTLDDSFLKEVDNFKKGFIIPIKRFEIETNDYQANTFFRNSQRGTRGLGFEVFGVRTCDSKSIKYLESKGIKLIGSAEDIWEKLKPEILKKKEVLLEIERHRTKDFLTDINSTLEYCLKEYPEFFKWVELIKNKRVNSALASQVENVVPANYFKDSPYPESLEKLKQLSPLLYNLFTKKSQSELLDALELFKLKLQNNKKTK